MLVLTILLAIIGGIAYRVGGASWGNRLFRILGVPFISLVTFWINAGWDINAWWIYAISFGLMAGAISTYHYWLPKPPDYEWYHYAMHGFFVSLAFLPLCILTGSWMWGVLRCVINAALLGGWSVIASWDDLEEWGRGFVLTGTTVLLR